MRQPIPLLGLLALAAYLVSGCHKAEPGGSSAPSGKKSPGRRGSQPLLVEADFMAPDTIPNFERQTGIKVRVLLFRHQ